MPNFDKQDEVQIYSGVPNRFSTKEQSSWKKFLGFFVPWLSHKSELSDRYLEAKVLHEEAAAFKTFAEGLTSLEIARKIAAEAAIKENEKLRKLGDGPFTEADITEQAEYLIKKMEYLKIVHGFNLLVERKSERNENPTNESAGKK